ncbi:MAG: hypothetical protein AAGB51_04655 [Planctomycetota bacterium]
MGRRVVSFQTTDELIAEAEAIAAKTGETRSQVLDRATQIGLSEMNTAYTRFETGLVGGMLTLALRNKSLMKTMSQLAGEPFDEDAFNERATRISHLLAKERRDDRATKE